MSPMGWPHGQLTGFLTVINHYRVMSAGVLHLHSATKESRDPHPHEELLKNILYRLDRLEEDKAKNLLSSRLPIDGQDYSKLRAQVRDEMLVSNENLRRLEEAVHENLEELLAKMRSFEAKTLRLFKQKNEAMQYIQYRIASAENSQKLVTDYMHKMTEQDNQKFSPVALLQERIRQVEQIGEIRQRKANDQIRIKTDQLELKISSDIQRQLAQFRSKIQATDMNKTESVNLDLTRELLSQLQKKVSGIEMVAQQTKKKVDRLQALQQEVAKLSQEIGRQSISFEQQPSYNRPGEDSYFHNQVSKNRKTEYGKQQLGVNDLRIPNTESNEHAPGLMGRKNSQSQLGNKMLGQLEPRNRLSSQRVEDSDDPFSDMVGGVRGLLKKSKQKDIRKPSNFATQHRPESSTNQKRPLVPPRKGLEPLGKQTNLASRNLPPVKADTRLKRQQRVAYSSPDSEIEVDEEDSQDYQVYNLDRDGYLLDEYGEYYYDQEGNRIQLSPDEIKQLTQQQQY